MSSKCPKLTIEDADEIAAQFLLESPDPPQAKSAAATPPAPLPIPAPPSPPAPPPAARSNPRKLAALGICALAALLGIAGYSSFAMLGVCVAVFIAIDPKRSTYAGELRDGLIFLILLGTVAVSWLWRSQQLPSPAPLTPQPQAAQQKPSPAEQAKAEAEEARKEQKRIEQSLKEADAKQKDDLLQFIARAKAQQTDELLRDRHLALEMLKSSSNDRYIPVPYVSREEQFFIENLVEVRARFGHCDVGTLQNMASAYGWRFKF